MNVEKNSSRQDTAVKATESRKAKHAFEIACAIVLALATTASAWCAYQSKRWSGVQASRGNAALRAGRAASVNSLTALQQRAVDASMFITFVQARLDQNEVMETFLLKRFRPEMRPAMEAWLKSDPQNNPAAPPTPFQMKEYVQKAEVDALQQEELARNELVKVGQARRLSDDYVLLTVIFASVLFFGGIARAFDSQRLKVVLMALAVVLFLGTIAALTTLPVCHE